MSAAHGTKKAWSGGAGKRCPLVSARGNAMMMAHDASGPLPRARGAWRATRGARNARCHGRVARCHGRVARTQRARRMTRFSERLSSSPSGWSILMDDTSRIMAKPSRAGRQRWTAATPIQIMTPRMTRADMMPQRSTRSVYSSGTRKNSKSIRKTNRLSTERLCAAPGQRGGGAPERAARGHGALPLSLSLSRTHTRAFPLRARRQRECDSACRWRACV